MTQERIEGVQAFLGDLYRLGLVMNSKTSVFAALVGQAWIRTAIRKRAFDTGAFVNSIDYRPDTEPIPGEADMAGFQGYVVDTEQNTEVNYSSLIERGTENIDGTVRMAARWPAKEGIESISFGSHIDGMVQMSFIHGV